MTEGTTSSEERGRQIGEAFGDLSDQIAALVRDELERARQETAERAREAAKAGSYLGLAGAFGLAGAGAALSLPVLALRRFLPPTATALAVGGGYGALAVVFGKRALERLEAAAPKSVEDKIEQKKEDVTTSLKERLPGSSES